MPDGSKICTRLHYQAHSLESRKIALELCEPNPNAKLLDCGCGDGEIAMRVAERIETKEVWGVEIMQESAVTAKERGIRVLRGDLNKSFAFKSETFVVVHAANIIEHLYDTDTFLKEVHRVLKVGGYFVVSTCNIAALHNIFFLLLGKQPPAADVSDEFVVGVWSASRRRKPGGPCHRRMFTLRALEGLLKCHGFEVEKSAAAGFYPLPPLLSRLMCKIDKKHSAYIIVKARKAK